jgi:hypothetical protein
LRVVAFRFAKGQAETLKSLGRIKTTGGIVEAFNLLSFQPSLPSLPSVKN